MDLATHFLATGISEFRKLKALGDKALSRLDEEELHQVTGKESNSIAVIIQHMSGNMVSRWTDFLTTDGEKPDRQRDREFEEGNATKESLLQTWEKGWAVLFGTLEALSGNDMLQDVYIRGERHTVLEAMSRQLSHYAYHSGQLVYLARMMKGNAWQSLSIPKGRSDEFNDAMKQKTK